MAIKIDGIQKWCYANLDLIEESLQKNNKALVLISGASASGKSFASEILRDFLKDKGLTSTIISTDSYNIGISGIIVGKVKTNAFNGNLKNSEQIIKQVKDIIIDSSFDEKFCEKNLIKIKKACKHLIDKKDMNIFFKQSNSRIC